MIDLQNARLTRGGKSEPITGWRTWFKTPFGYAESLEEAQEVIATSGLNAHMTIQPIPVAESETMIELYDHGG